jgi:hypothetical protein
MHLRSLIQGGRPVGDPRTPATLATVATVHPETGPTVARVATVAALGPPENWPALLRCVAAIEAIRWDLAADALDMLLISGVVDKALALGWDARELIGVCRGPPHDSPSRAGLIWSVKPGDTVPDVRRSGCIIAYGNVRHIWKRAPIGADTRLAFFDPEWPWRKTRLMTGPGSQLTVTDVCASLSGRGKSIRSQSANKCSFDRPPPPQKMHFPGGGKCRRFGFAAMWYPPPMTPKQQADEYPPSEATSEEAAAFVANCCRP